MLKEKPQKLVITVENVNQADAIALKKMFEYMEYLGIIGSSRNIQNGSIEKVTNYHDN